MVKLLIIVLDVGNTNVVIGFYDGDNLLSTGRIATDKLKTGDEYAIDIKNIIEINGVVPSELEGSVISSVVPPLTNTLKAVLEKLTGKTPFVVGPGIKTGLNIKTDNPSLVGSDRIVDAVAAISEHTPPLIIIDMGTATTMSVIDENNTYIGGVIAPGLKITQEALAVYTSQLPNVSLDNPKSIIGKNTVDCIQSGLLYGHASMVDGMISLIEEEIGKKTTVVATGGLSKFIVPLCRHEIHRDEMLLLKGLRLIYENNKNR